MFPPEATAASLVPSLEEVMARQYFTPPTDVSSVQVAPESVEVQMLPSPPERSLRVTRGFLATAASLVPSLEEVMPYQNFGAPTDVSSVQVREAFVGAIAISVKNKVRNKRYVFDAARGAPGTNAYARCRISFLSVFSFSGGGDDDRGRDIARARVRRVCVCV